MRGRCRGSRTALGCGTGRTRRAGRTDFACGAWRARRSRIALRTRLSFAASRQSKRQNDDAQCPKTLHHSSFLDFATPTVVRYSVSFGRMEAGQPYLTRGALRRLTVTSASTSSITPLSQEPAPAHRCGSRCQSRRNTNGGCTHRQRCVRYVAARRRRHGERAAGRGPSSPGKGRLWGWVDTPVAVGRPLGEDCLDLRHSLPAKPGPTNLDRPGRAQHGHLDARYDSVISTRPYEAKKPRPT